MREDLDVYSEELAKVLPVKNLSPIYFNEKSRVYKGFIEETVLKLFLQLKPVAIKICTKKGIVQNINKETAILKTIKHPGIVKYECHGWFKTFWGESVRYLMEEYIPGDTISKRVDSKGAMDWEDALEYTLQICDVLKTFHDRKLLVADLKPDNIFITPQNKIKFVDFGAVQKYPYIVKDLAPGTIGYMCPDWIINPQVDARVDIYTLGIILYEMLTGKIPFKEELDDAESTGSFECLLKEHWHCHLKLDRPSINRNVPKELEKIYRQMMTPRLLFRYETIDAVIKDLKQVH